MIGMEFQFYCEKMSEYYGLYVNETCYEVKFNLWQCVCFYKGCLDALFKKESEQVIL